jgi:mRNA interferase MazF
MLKRPRRTVPPRDIRQGEIYRVVRPAGRGHEIAGVHPHVVIQNDLTNRSGIQTILVAPLTSSMARARHPGNMIVDPSESGLEKRSVVNVSQIATVDRRYFRDYVGQLSDRRVREIISGLNMLLTPRG